MLVSALCFGVTGIFVGMKGLLTLGKKLPGNETSLITALTEDDMTRLKVSVIVYASVTEEVLSEYLSGLLSQDYSEFEIIVVYDASYAAATTLSENLASNERIRITFIPPGSHNLSRRKLALTLGMKAAKGDIVLTTVANSLIPSTTWLSEMMHPFHEGKEVVLGYSHPSFRELRGWGRWYRQFDRVLTSSAWIGSALNDSPFRGDGNNLAFRRELFFSNKGYASNINLHSGEDDIFVSEIVNEHNTSVIINPRTILTTFWGGSANRVMTDSKERYDFTSRWLPKAPYFRLGWISFSSWLTLVSLVSAILSVIPGIFGFLQRGCAEGGIDLLLTILLVTGAVLVWILVETGKIMVYRKGASRLEAVRLWWSLPLFFLWHPLGNFFFRINHHSGRYKNFTWQRH